MNHNDDREIYVLPCHNEIKSHQARVRRAVDGEFNFWLSSYFFTKFFKPIGAKGEYKNLYDEQEINHKSAHATLPRRSNTKGLEEPYPVLRVSMSFGA